MLIRSRSRIIAQAVTLAMLLIQMLPGLASAAPPAPLQVSPADGSPIPTGTMRPTVNWQASVGATQYAVDIADNAMFWGPVTSGWQSSLSFTPLADLKLNTLYYWRVKAVNTSGVSDPSAMWRFWMPLTLSSPADGAALTSLTPTLSWSTYKTGNDTTTRSYRVQVSQDPSFASGIAVDSTTTGSSYVVPSGLLFPSQTYYWRVSVSSADGTSGWSDVRSFSSPTGPPAAPSLISPANGAALDNWRPLVSWSPSVTATSYRVHCLRSGSAEWISGDLTTTSFALDTFLTCGATPELSSYEWWVEARNASGSTPSSHWTFTTPARQQPSTPTLLTPANGAAVTGLFPVLDWTDTTYTKNYSLQVGTGATAYGVTGVLANVPINDSIFTYPTANYTSVWPLDYNTTYYWRVTSFSIGAISAVSSVWSFRTPPPPGTDLTAPANGAVLNSRTPTLSWAPAASALSYRVQVATSDSFAALLAVNASVDAASGSSYTLPSPLDYNVTYYWRVNFTNSLGTSNWSAVWSFRAPPPPGPDLLSPSNGSTLTTRTPILSWGPVAGALSYQVQASTTDSFTTPLVIDIAVPAASGGSFTLPTPLDYNIVYYWRVNFTNGAGTSLWSATWNLKGPQPPGPALTSPADGDTLSTLTPLLSWSPVTGASSYRVQVSTSNSFTTALVVDATVDATSGSLYGLPTPLDYNIVYYWRVNFTDGTGVSLWSATWSLKAPPPLGPNLVSPANDSTASTQTPTMSWVAVADALTYQVQVASNESFQAPLVVNASVDAATGSSYTVPVALDPGGNYYWRVSFTNSAGTSYWSTMWHLRGPGAPPDPLSPTNGSVVASLTPTLSWSAIPGALTYRVQVASSAAFATPLLVDTSVDAATGSSYTLSSPIEFNGIYWWRVNFTDSAATSLWSVPWSLQGPPPIPLAPSLQTPGSSTGGSIVGFRPAFDWADSAFATSYDFQLAMDASFTAKFVDAAGLGSSSIALSSDLTPSTTFYWRASASNSTGTGEWSTPYSFTTPLPAPAAPTLLAPSAGSTSENLRPYFDWTDSDRATSYTLQLYTNAGLTSLVANVTVTTSDYTPLAELTANTTYYWTVQAANETSLGGPWSAAISFSTPAIPPPGIPVLSTPASGVTVDTLAPTLDWQDDNHSDGYRIQISKSSLFSPLVADLTIGSSMYVRPSWLPLDVDNDYYWRVLGINATGQGQFSDAWVFRTPAVPAVPTLVSPSDGTVIDTVTPLLTLGGVPSATGYTIQLSTASWFSGPILVTSSTPAVRVTTPLVYNKLYYWRASATNAAGTSVWSSSSMFTTPLPPPAPIAPTPVSPIGGVVNNSRPTLDWSDVENATKYLVAWSKQSNFQWTEASRDNLPSSSFTLDVDLPWSTQYYWRVKASGPGGDSPWSAISGFQVPSGPPGLPTLLSPADGSATASPLQKLDWSDANLADSYQVQVATDASFGTTLVDASANASEFTITSPLATSATYFWRVKAINGVGDSGWTTAASFVVPPPPGPVTLLTPDNGITVATLMPVFDWGDVVGASGYEVRYAQFSTLLPGVTPATVSASSYTMSSKLPLDTDCFWQVRATNGSGVGPWSAVWQFRTPATPPVPPPPAAPILEQPADDATLLTITPTFIWNAAAEADGYYVQLSTDPGFGTLLSNEYTTAVSRTLSVPLSYATTYYWRIRAENVAGSTDSVIRTFATPLPSLPFAPLLSTPKDGAVVDALAPTLEWQAESLSTGYQVQLSKSSLFSTVVADVMVTSPTYVRPDWQKLEKDMTYYWRVRGTNARGSGPWTDAWSFRTPAVPAVPTLAAPADAAVLSTITPTLTLNSVPGATSYTVQLSTASWFSGPIVVTSSTPEVAVTTLLAFNRLYYWRASASTAAGTSAWSASRRFTTPPPPAVPVAPTPLSPNSTTSLSSTRPTLDWEDVANATKYRAEWSKSATFSWTEAARDNLTESSFTMELDLPWNAQYHWRVRATGLGGDGPWSPITAFRTPLGLPGLSIPLSPADGSTATTRLPKLDWSDAFAAESYQVQVSTDSAFGTTLIDSSVPASEFTPIVPLSIDATYYWRVKTINTVGESGWTSAWSFVVPPPPGVVTLLSPDDGVTVATLKPTLDWADLTTAISYEVRWSRSNTFAWGVNSTTATVSGYDIPSNLPLGVDFFWEVRAVNAAGVGPWSAARSFHTPTIQPCTAIPTVPSLLGPASGSLYMTVTPTFSWDAADCATGGYQVQIATDAGFRSIVSNEGTAATSHTQIAPLNYSTLYYWRIRALNSVGSAYSAVRTFTTDGAPRPDAPTLLSPANDSTIDSLSPPFDWTDSAYAVGYRIQISLLSNFTSSTVNTTLSASGYTLSTWTKLAYGRTYYWRVQAYNARGAGDWSPVSSFTTPAPPQPPVAPSLTSPGVLVGGSIPLLDTLKPAFVWDAVSGATAYKLQVSRNVGFTSLLANATSTGSTYTFPTSLSLAKNTQYWWRVQSTNSAGSSPWSAIFTFKTMADPAVPALSGPISGSVVGSLTPTVDWGDVSGAVKYHIIIATNPWFGTRVVDVDVTDDSSFTLPTNLAPRTTYYWKVNATNAVGTSAWSPTWSFKTPS